MFFAMNTPTKRAIRAFSEVQLSDYYKFLASDEISKLFDEVSKALYASKDNKHWISFEDIAERNAGENSGKY